MLRHALRQQRAWKVSPTWRAWQLRGYAAGTEKGSAIADAGAASTVLSRAEEKGTADRIRGLPTREEQIEKLKAGEMFDVLVVGGGATGSGTALDAQLRGLLHGAFHRVADALRTDEVEA